MNRRLGLALVACALAQCGTSPIDAVGVAPAARSESLLGHWRFDETSGDVAHDSSGNGRDGLVVGGAWKADGRFGGALFLNTFDSVSVANFPQAAPSWTVSVWLRQLTEDLAWGPATVLSTEIHNTGGWQMNIFPPNGGNAKTIEFAYWYQPRNDYVGVRCQCLIPDVWFHLAAVVDAEEAKILLYQNGMLKVTNTMPGKIAPGTPTLLMGVWNDPKDPRPYNGALDDVAVFNRALTAEEVRLLSQNAVIDP